MIIVLGAFLTSAGMLFHKVGATTENAGIGSAAEDEGSVHTRTKAMLTSIPVPAKC